MKWKSKFPVLLASTVFMAVAAGPYAAMAAPVQKQIPVTYQNIKVAVNQHQESLKDASGYQIEPFNYNGTVYLPIRAISQLLGFSVSYDASTSTVSLTSGSAAAGTQAAGTPPMGTPPTGSPSQAPSSAASTSAASHAAVHKELAVTFNDIKVNLNKKLVDLKDASGNPVEPFNYKGTIYLPVRAISQALGLTVSYDAAANTVQLDGGNSSPSMGPIPGGEQSAASSVEGTGKVSFTGSTENLTGQEIQASAANESGVKVSEQGQLTLSDSSVDKAGDTTSEDSSNFYGLNAGILAASGSQVTLDQVKVTTDSDGSNAVFATGAGSVINASDLVIHTSKNSSRGLDATMTGTINAANVDITTLGDHSAALATDRGNGTIVVKGGTLNTAGDGSPGIYSTGSITVSDVTSTATGSEAAVIEGRNSITLTNSSIYGAKKQGVMIYQSFSGDAEVGTGTFTMTGGSLTAATGPLFYSTNTVAVINLKGVTLQGGSGVLLSAGADRWGSSGSNGAKVTLNADAQTLTGNVNADNTSSITAHLTNGSALSGALNPEQTAKSMDVSLDASSTWEVTGDSYLTSLSDEDVTLANIHDHGFTIYYDASSTSNSWLNGKTVTLSGGGMLTPVTKG